MKIKTVAFEYGDKIPVKYTCDGENINPSFTFIDVPREAKSLSLIMDDPDSPTGTWVHWTAWNIMPQTYEISENSIPAGSIEGITSFDSVGYGGPCPGVGEHRYFFKLYALDTMLNLKEGSSKKELINAMKGHILEETQLMGKYKRMS